MVVADAELLNTANQYKTELLAKMFRVTAQAASQGIVATISNLPFGSNVVGVGYGVKVTNGAIAQDEIAVRVYVRTKLPNSLLFSREKVPSDVNGVPTDVIPVGDIVSFGRPTKCGASIGHHKVTAGTLGCLVKRSSVNTDECYILSNNHILANCNNATIGDAILEPGFLDGGHLLPPIAELTDFEPLQMGNGVNVMDAAIAKVLNRVDVIPEIIEIGKVQQPTILAMLKQFVCKYGRTTQYTEGVVSDLSANISVIYNNMYASFEDQIAIDGINSFFSALGDSGSLVVDRTNQQPLGLIFAGGSIGTSFATPISQILMRFQVEIL